MRISATPSAAAGALYISVLLVLSAVFCGPGATSAWSQVPDNRGLKLDPEDSVPPAYRDTLDRRDRQRLDAAREAGDSFMPVFQGRGAAPGAGPPAGALLRRGMRSWRRRNPPTNPTAGRNRGPLPAKRNTVPPI